MPADETTTLLGEFDDKGLINYMVRNQPLFKKVEFIRKTYGILAMWLLLSFVISTPFMRDQQGTVDWLSHHNWILWLAVVVLCLQMAFYLTICAFLYTGQNMLFRVYRNMLKKFPVNYLWTLLYVASFTLVVDSALSAFGWALVAYAFLYTAIAVLGVLLYTYAIRNPDFKQLYAYLVPIGTAVIIWISLVAFADVHTERLEHGVAMFLSIMFGWIVVFDTQLIFGTKIERGRKYPYIVSMYAMAAYEMYFDLFIHFYLGALNLFPGGETDDPEVKESLSRDDI